MDKHLISLMYLILSTMIGAGIIALPYVFYSIGILPSLILFALASFFIYITSIILLKASLKYYRTTIPQIFERYLGESFKKLSFILTSLSIIFVCIAYLNVINFSIKTFLKDSEIYTLLISALLMSIAFIGFSLVEKSEKILFTLKFLIIFLFLSFIIFVPKKYEIKNFSFDIMNYLQFLLVSIFAFSFYTVIPSLLHISKDEKILKNSILLSILIAFTLYFTFSYIVSLRSGNSEISTLSFSEFFDILTIFLVITPYLILSWVLSEILVEELKIEKKFSILLSFGIPFILFVIFPKTFLTYLEITSAFFILTTYFLIGLIGYKYSEKLRINKLYSLFVIMFSLLLIIFEIFNLIS